MSDGEPSPEERASAEALATALERGKPAPADVGDVLALLRFAREGGLTQEKRAAAPVARPRRARWALRAGFAAAAAAAAVLVLQVFVRGGSPTALPAPGAALLRAQSRAAAGDRASRLALDEQMGAYRRDVLASLERRYAR